jgi:hypothetical protein
MTKQPKPYPLRLEPELKQWVKGRAKDGDRSFNAEVRQILKAAKEADEQKTNQTAKPTPNRTGDQ